MRRWPWPSTNLNLLQFSCFFHRTQKYTFGKGIYIPKPYKVPGTPRVVSKCLCELLLLNFK